MEDNYYEFAHYERSYTVWILVVLILILIAIVAVVFALDDLSRTLQKKIIVPIKEKVDSIESQFASVEARAGDIGDRIQGWDQMLRNTVDQETVEKGKLALDNLAFGLMESSTDKHHRPRTCKRR